MITVKAKEEKQQSPVNPSSSEDVVCPAQYISLISPGLSLCQSPLQERGPCIFKADLKPTHTIMSHPLILKMTVRSQVPGSYHEEQQLAGHWTPLHSLYEDLQ